MFAIRQTARPLAAVLISLIVAAGPAVAGDQRAEVGNPPAMAEGAAADAMTDAEIRALWTPERMAQAEGRAMKAHTEAAAGGNLEPQYGGAQTPAQTWRLGWVSVPAQVGRLYFNHPDGTPDSCTATLVAVNILITAGHCVVLQNAWNDAFKWVPATWGGSEPYGSWTAGKFDTTAWTAWARDLNFGQDYAFIRLRANQAGVLPGNVVGWMGIAIDQQSYPSGIWSLGYPATGYFAPYQGAYSRQCYSPYSGFFVKWTSGGVSDAQVAAYEVAIGCDMTGGASGGPWVIPINGSWQYVNSVNSNCWAVYSCKDYQSQNMWGPWFDRRVIDLFNYLKSR